MIPITPWIDRTFDFNFPVGLFPIIVERLRGTIPRLYDLIKNIDEEKLALKSNGKWSVKEGIGHLYDLEELWIGRIEDFLTGKVTLRAADMTNAKTHAANHNEQLAKILFEEFRSAREQLVFKVKNADEQMAMLTAIHPRLQKPMRLVDSLYFVAEHDDHEIAKIRSLLR